MNYGCFDPQRVYNKHLGEYVYVDCRKCAYCLNRKAYDLSGRIEREFKSPRNGTCYFVTLTYDNAHLPIYVNNGDTFYSNREGYDVLLASDVPEYYRPEGIDSDCFSFLCYEDVQGFLGRLRANFYHDCSEKRSFDYKIKHDIYNLSYEDLKYRYFVCGEYGPSTFRAHYHLLLWFSGRHSDRLANYVSQIVHKAWTFGLVDIQPVVTPEIKCYLGNYVTSVSDLPLVLQIKSIRPFYRCSSSPAIGFIDVNFSEIQESLNTGVVERYKWDERSAQFIPESLPPSFFRRYFPKCQGFSTLARAHKLRVYSYVFNYFKDCKITHSLEDLDNIYLRDIPFPVKLSEDGIEEWSYRDKYASLVCYRYCVAFGYTPDAVLASIERIYLKIFSKSMQDYYESIEKDADKDYYVFNCNYDPDFLYRLPAHLELLRESTYNLLEFYGIDIDYLYPNNNLLSVDNVKKLFFQNDPNFVSHCERVQSFAVRGVKVKKMNDYKSRLKSNLVRNNYKFKKPFDWYE